MAIGAIGAMAMAIWLISVVAMVQKVFALLIYAAMANGYWC
jgi:hypothetical protein